MPGDVSMHAAHPFEKFEHQGRRVTVIGAGISGLVTAYELERLGYTVEVLECGARIGGRIRTHRFGPGPDTPSVELGAMRIPAHHHRTLEYVQRMQLGGELRAFSTLMSEENAYLRTPGGFLRIRNASAPLLENFRRELARHCPGSNSEPLFGERRYDDSVLVVGAWLTAIVDATAPPDLRTDLREDLRRQLLDLLAGVDLARYLRGPAGERVDLQGLFAAHPGLRAGCSLRLNSFLDDILAETAPGLLRLRGGMDRLPARLARQLRGPVLREHRVTGLEVHEDHVAVRVRAAGRTGVRRSDFAVCTVPFPVLRRMRLRGLDADKLAVLREVQYCPATKVAFLCRTPFWRESGIQGGASFAGGRIRQTYYPPVEGMPGRGAALLASYTIGEEARRLGRMPARRRHRLVLDELGAMHPELTSPGMVLDAVSMAWGSDRGSVGCTTRWGRNAAESESERLRAARPVGRLFFAGEHCSTAPAWIEGGIESALRAVEELVRFEPVRRRPAVPAPGRPRPAGAL
ncbi:MULTISPECIES: NAD(P)/FAD-dependent oxidoreductase [Streptomyces]|uniref:Amine oxidase domain-containing protein n=1 Tax=Streptomyces luteosporeus TaxID=173856 RepID=A0ABP6G8W1_9ACTN